MTIQELRAALAKITARCNEITSGAKADNGDPRQLTEAEASEVDGLYTQFEELQTQLERAEKLDKITSAPAPGRRADPAPLKGSGNQQITGGEPRQKDDPRAGFKDFGDFAFSVRTMAQQGGAIDPRLAMYIKMAPTTVATEGVGADGGVAVPPEWSDQIKVLVEGDMSLLQQTDQHFTSRNSMSWPVDEEAPHSSAGIQGYWVAEAAQLTQTKPRLVDRTLRLHKRAVLVPVSDELLGDSTAMSSYLPVRTGQNFVEAVNDAIIDGDGSGKPQGILNSGSLVTVAKETSQAADTVLALNVFKMWSRAYAVNRGRMVWLINQDVEPQLFSMVIPVLNVAGTENVGGGVVYQPPGGISASPYGTLMGRPVIVQESCKTLGDLGDIIFADLGSYQTLQKTTGPQNAISPHLWFDYDVNAFKTTFRIDGQSWWNKAVTPKNGSNTRSPFVTLAARA